jgi:two-component system, OmpR family, response regulator VicR
LVAAERLRKAPATSGQTPLGLQKAYLADGEEGLRLYEEHHSRIALLLSDVRMPNMGGLELADRVLGMDSRLPVLLMSGDAECDYGSFECMVKPFRPAELIGAVSRALNASRHSERTISAA